MKRLIALIYLMCTVSYAQFWDYSITAGSAQQDYGNCMKLDSQGGVIVHGRAATGSDFGGIIFNYTGNFVAKYDSTGIAEWVIPAGESLSLTAINKQTNGGIVLDDLDNIYVTGTFSDSCYIGDSTIYGNSSNFNVFIAKIDPSGVVLWTKYVTDNSVTTGISLDANGNVLVCGYTEGVSDFDGNIITPYGSSNDRDVIFAKYDNNGSFQWVRQCGGPGAYADRAFAITCDAQNNVIVAGHIRSDSDFGGLTLLSTAPFENYYNGFITKYDSNGNAIWVDYCGYHATALTTLSNGVIYVGGYAAGIDNGFDSLLTAQSDKMFVAKMDSSGNYIWANSNGGTGVSGVSDIASDAHGNCFITGHFTHNAHFATDTLLGNGGGIWYTHMFIANYDSLGNEIWVDNAGGGSGSHTWGFGIDAKDSCKYVVGGSFQAPPDVIHEDTLTAFGSYDIFYSYRRDWCGAGQSTVSEFPETFQVDIYPNPTSSNVNLNLAEPIVCCRVQLQNLNGQVVNEWKFENKNLIQLDLSSVVPGVYLISIANTSGNMVTKKIIKTP